MTDLTIQSLKFQGKKAKAIYAYKATMNDELSFKVDDLITITQCSDDETWLEGTLNSRTGWFPSNYVSVIDEETETNDLGKEDELILLKNDTSLSENNIRISSDLNKNDEDLRIKNITEIKVSEEAYLDDMCKFVKIALIPLQANNTNASGAEILPNNLIQILNTTLDDVINCHQIFFQQLKDIPDNVDAKIGHLFISMAPQFKQVYDSYSKINPKFTNAINKNKELVGKYFETSAAFNKIKSPLMPNNSLNASIYLSKNLAAPFKQLEFYLKILKEIQRYTEDFHVDRGDVQRSIEFYSDLSTNVHEIRRRKECEIDIMSGQIKNIDEDLFQNGESLFLSSVLIVNESGEKQDRILLLFPQHLVILAQNLNSTFEFIAKIPFLNANNTQLNIQIKRVNNIELIDSIYSANNGSSLIDSISGSKYCFELLTSNNPARYLIICSSHFDIKMWIELISTQISKLQFALNNKSLTPSHSSCSSTTNTNNANNNNNKSLVSKEHASPKSPTPNQQLSNSIKKVNQALKQQSTKSSSTSTSTNSSCTTNSTPVNHNLNVRKHFTMRPHPALIPHFQLPADVPTNSLNTSLQVLASNESGQVKRFMYKKAKLSEPFGKYHGADDDLKLLNVIESFCKTKIRQSVSVQDSVSTTLTSGNTKLAMVQRNESIDRKLNDDKQANLESLIDELNENKKSNKELKMMVSSLQKQLESERLSRKKLESFIKKTNKLNQHGAENINQLTLTNDLPSISIINVEHESSI